MLYNTINNGYSDGNERITYEIDIQKESPNASFGNNFTKMLKDLDFDMQNNQNIQNTNKLNNLENNLNFELSLSTNGNFNGISSLKFENEIDFSNSFVNINPFPTSTPKKLIPNTSILNIPNDIPGNINDNITNKNDINIQNNNKNENGIINNNDNSITNVNIHVNNFNVNGNTMIHPFQENENKKDTLSMNNLNEPMTNLKIDYDSPLSENMRNYTSQFANSLGKYDNYILDADSKDFKDLQGKLIYDTVENYDHFSDSEIKIEFNDIDEINKLNGINPITSSNNKKDGNNNNNFNLLNTGEGPNCIINNDNEDNNKIDNNNNSTITSYEKAKNIQMNNPNSDNGNQILQQNNRFMLPDPHEENYNKKVRFQSIDELQKLKELNNQLLIDKDSLEKQLSKYIYIYILNTIPKTTKQYYFIYKY